MKNLFLIVCFLSCYIAHSQSLDQATIFASSSKKSHNSQVIWTLGDAQTTTYANAGIIMNQGFLQTNMTVTAINTVQENSLMDLKAYPNPVKDILNIEFNSLKTESMHFELYTINGKLINSRKVEAKNYQGTIDFKQFRNGFYLLKAVSENGSYMKTFKVFYQN